MLRLPRIPSLVLLLIFLLPALGSAQTDPFDKVLGTISGRVTLDDGSPAVGFTVYATPQWYRGMNPQPVDWNHAVTDKDGHYSFTLRRSKYNFMSGPFRALDDTSIYVAVLNGGKPYIEPDASRVDPVKAPDHAVSNVDFVLHLGPQIIVKVHDAITHAPVSGVKIRLEGQSTSEPSVDGVTGADGTFAIRLTYTDIEMHADFPQSASPDAEFAPSYGQGRENYQRVKAEPGKDLNWEIKTYGTTQKSDWHGVVLDLDGKPASDVQVRLTGSSIDTVILTTDAQGRFSALLPRLGNYQDGSGPLLTAKKGDLVAGIRMTPDQTWDGVTLHLAPGATFSGQLIDPQGRPAFGANIALDGVVLKPKEMIASTSYSWQPADPFLPTVVTDTQGRYTIHGLLPGNYRIKVNGGGWGELAFPASDPLYDPALLLEAGQHLDLGTHTVPPADKILTIHVVDTSGKPVPNLGMFVDGTHTHQRSNSQLDGTYYVYDLVDEPLKLTNQPGNPDIQLDIPRDQWTMRVIVPAAATATPPASVPASTTVPPPVPFTPPSDPPRLGGSSQEIPFDNLVLNLDADEDGVVTASVFRPNSVDAIWGNMMPFQINDSPKVWHGTLADLDGLHLAVKNDHGILTSRKGDVLWSGIVVDPPDYVITIRDRPHLPPGRYQVSVQNNQGKTLWADQADLNQNFVENNQIRIISPQHTVAFERGIADARVAVRTIDRAGTSGADWQPLQIDLTLHVATVIATLRAQDGTVLWTGQMPAMLTSLNNFLPMPPKKDGKLTEAGEDWNFNRYHLPGDMVPLRVLSNIPNHAVLSFTDSAGKPIPNATVTYG